MICVLTASNICLYKLTKVACEVKLLRRKGKEPPATSAPSEEQTPTTSRDLMQRLSQPKSHAKTSVVEGNDEASPPSDFLRSLPILPMISNLVPGLLSQEVQS